MGDSKFLRKYDLEERTYEFARDCRYFVRCLKKNLMSFEDGKQLVRSSGSVAANYIEANEALTKKDFVYRIKICLKESKESQLWLRLLVSEDLNLEDLRRRLLQEAVEFRKIFSAILLKSK